MWFCPLNIRSPDGVRAAPLGQHVYFDCGCIAQYLFGEWRGMLTICWMHEATRAFASAAQAALFRN